MGRFLHRFTNVDQSQAGAGHRWDGLKSVLGRMFAADLRSLAALRIVIAVLILVDLASRATSLRIMYTDEGILPRRVVIDALSPWSWSLGFMSGSVPFQQALFLVTAGAALCLLLGYQTRLMTVVAWILISSIHVRNPLILSGGDLRLRMLLFWGMFLPLGATWSLDRWRQRPAPSRAMRFLSAASVALFLQVAFMYWFTAALKTGPEWREDGTALFYVLRRPLYTTSFGEWAQQFTGVLHTLSFGTMVVEIVAPILLFSPVWTTRLRLVGIVSLVGLHIGIMTTMSIGAFPWVGASCMLMFLPAPFWERAEEMVRGVASRHALRWPRILAAFGQPAQGVAQRVHAWLYAWSGRPASLSFSTQAGGPPPDRIDRALPAKPAGEIPGLPPVEEPGLQPVALRTPWPLNVLAAALLVFVFGWNMTTVTAFTMPSPSTPIAYALNIQQNWVMFAPGPPHFNTRYVLMGTLRDGQEVEMLLPVIEGDLGTVEPFTWDKPANLDTGYYQDMRWRLYLARLGSASKEQRYAFATYVCRTWNGHYNGDLEVASMVYVYVIEDILPDGSLSGERTSGFGPYTCT